MASLARKAVATSTGCSSSSLNSTTQQLVRLRLSATFCQSQSRSFASTPSREAVAKKKAAPAKKKSTVRKKNGPSGPRSAGGKRKGGSGSPTLSMSSANPPADLSSLPTLTPENAVENNLFKPMALGDKVRNALKVCGAPNGVGKVLSSQSRPWLLFRPQTLSILNHLDSQSSPSSTLPRSSLIPTIKGGGTGSSSLLLQSVSYALDSSWIVVYLPRTRSLVDGSSPYFYSSSLKSYFQPSRTRELLTSILSLNGNLLKEIHLPQGIDLPTGGSEGTSSEMDLQSFIKDALNQPASSNPAHLYLYLDVTLRTLANQTKLPYLLAVDEVQALFQQTKYRDPDYQILKPQDLSLGRLMRASLALKGAQESQSGVDEKEKNLPGLQIKRGTAISALSYSDDSFPVKPDLLLALHRSLKKNQGQNQDLSISSGEETLIPKIDLSVSSNLYHPSHRDSTILEQGLKGGLPVALSLRLDSSSSSSPSPSSSSSESEAQANDNDNKVDGNGNGQSKVLNMLMDTREAKELYRMKRWEMGHPGYTELANGLTDVETGSDEKFLSKFIETGGNMREFRSALSRSVM